MIIRFILSSAKLANQTNIFSFTAEDKHDLKIIDNDKSTMFIRKHTDLHTLYNNTSYKF